MTTQTHTPKNSGQRGRDVLAEAVNRAADEGAKSILCRPQYAADVIEQRDDLLAALEHIKSHYGAYLDCAPMGLGDDDGLALVAMDAALSKARGES
jgi:hypothetical protein